MTIGDRMKIRRLELKLVQEDVALIVGVTKQTIQKYENNIITNIPSDKIELIAKALNTSPAYLMGWEDDEKQSIVSENALNLTRHEKNLIIAYRDHPEMQKPVDRLLGIEEEKVHIIPIAARNGNNKPLKLTDSELDALKNLPDVPPEL